jgi:preprotein translocase subunit SecD
LTKTITEYDSEREESVKHAAQIKTHLEEQKKALVALNEAKVTAQVKEINNKKSNIEFEMTDKKTSLGDKAEKMRVTHHKINVCKSKLKEKSSEDNKRLNVLQNR